MTGVIFDVKRFAVHDGGGLRTTLFLKGCPLRCPWCQNPEGLVRSPMLWHNPVVCLKCGSCVPACPQGALTLTDRIHVDRARCVACGKCEDVCPAAAMATSGETVNAEEAASRLLRDQVFFGEHGGVTLSGGEVLAQWEFAREVLAICKEAGADTAIETCLLASREAVEALLPVVDHFIIDIKYADGETHRRVLGAHNAQILENFRFLVERGADVLVRTPLIPGYTATEENIRAIARLIREVDPAVKYELLNFNPLCRSKYSAMEQDYPVLGGALPEAEMDAFRAFAAQEGLTNIIKE